MIRGGHHSLKDFHECTPPHAHDLLRLDCDQLVLAPDLGGASHSLSTRGGRLQRQVLLLMVGPFHS